MKKIELIIIIIVFFISCNKKQINFNELEERNGVYYEIEKQKPFTGKSREYYKSGQLQEEGTFKNGILEGPYKKYYTNGKLYSKVTYKNNKLDGLLKRYYMEGQLWEEETYENGIYVESKRHYEIRRKSY